MNSEILERIAWLYDQAKESENNGFSSDAEAFWMEAHRLEESLK